MGVRDRGKLKWLPAHFMPEHRSLLRNLDRDYHSVQKPIIDEYEIEEFENRIHSAMEFNQAVKLTTWQAGYTYEVICRVHYLDPIRKELRVVSEDGAADRILFADLVAVEINE